MVRALVEQVVRVLVEVAEAVELAVEVVKVAMW